MDTPRTPDEVKAKVAADLDRIRQHMPRVYAAIQAKAKEIGNAAYGHVKKACAGQANTFYAIEGGHVVGTPFAMHEIERDLAQAMCTFGIDHVVLWTAEALPGQKGGA